MRSSNSVRCIANLKYEEDISASVKAVLLREKYGMLQYAGERGGEYGWNDFNCCASFRNGLSLRNYF